MFVSVFFFCSGIFNCPAANGGRGVMEQEIFGNEVKKLRPSGDMSSI